MEYTPAKTIDEVIAQLDEVVKQASETNDPVGIFAALYLVVTEKVKEGIARGDVFEDNPRMERLDVIFANRYLEALHQYRNKQKCSRCWWVAFGIAGRFPTHLIIQELLVGMNAHINLDLGIAASEASAGEGISHLKNDFFAINKILNALVDDIKNDLSSLSPRFGWILKYMVGEDLILSFGIKIARDEAWKFAKKLHALEGQARQDAITEKDVEATRLGNMIGRPGWWQNLIVWWVKRKENTDVAHIIADLRQRSSDLVRFPNEIPD